MMDTNATFQQWQDMFHLKLIKWNIALLTHKWMWFPVKFYFVCFLNLKSTVSHKTFYMQFFSDNSLSSVTLTKINNYMCLILQLWVLSLWCVWGGGGGGDPARPSPYLSIKEVLTFNLNETLKRDHLNYLTSSAI